MHQPLISTRVALTLIVALWGFAAWLDQPLGDEATAAEKVPAEISGTHLRCVTVMSDSVTSQRASRPLLVSLAPDLNVAIDSIPTTLHCCGVASSTDMELQMHHTDIRSTELSKLVPVRSVTDLEWLVKESEMVTGKPGRHFIVVGGDRPAYQVRLDSSGFEVIRVDVDPLGTAPTHSSKPEFLQHPVASAMACGRLYTAKVH